MKEKSHLPLFGVGPVIIAFQILITMIGIIVSYRGYFDAGKKRIIEYTLKDRRNWIDFIWLFSEL